VEVEISKREREPCVFFFCTLTDLIHEISPIWLFFFFFVRFFSFGIPEKREEVVCVFVS
jgi:hypothetical protein